MKYKLNPELRQIKSNVILVIEGQEHEYSCGEKLMELTFDKWYLVDSITARENRIVVSLRENDQILNMNWIGEEAVSFM